MIQKNILNEIRKAVLGKEEELKVVLAVFFSGGHVLIEDPPGLGKTLLARAVARAVGLEFKRIQLTPDVLPLDITGSFVWKSDREEFVFYPGPVFTNVLLADELNRTTPRTQSALLEAMEERQVTVEGKTFSLPEPFFVIATQNPYEHHGTFPLPESQLDRIAVSLSLGYPGENEEKEIVRLNAERYPLENVRPVADRNEILAAFAGVKKIRLDEKIVDYAVRIVRKTREQPDVVLGASPRAAVALAETARGYAFLEERDYVIPDDVKKLAPYVLRHRLVMRGKNSEETVRRVLETVDAPVII